MVVVVVVVGYACMIISAQFQPRPNSFASNWFRNAESPPPPPPLPPAWEGEGRRQGRRKETAARRERRGRGGGDALLVAGFREEPAPGA